MLQSPYRELREERIQKSPHVVRPGLQQSDGEPPNRGESPRNRCAENMGELSQPHLARSLFSYLRAEYVRHDRRIAPA